MSLYSTPSYPTTQQPLHPRECWDAGTESCKLYLGELWAFKRKASLDICSPPTSDKVHFEEWSLGVSVASQVCALPRLLANAKHVSEGKVLHRDLGERLVGSPASHELCDIPTVLTPWKAWVKWSNRELFLCSYMAEPQLCLFQLAP